MAPVKADTAGEAQAVPPHPPVPNTTTSFPSPKHARSSDLPPPPSQPQPQNKPHPQRDAVPSGARPPHPLSIRPLGNALGLPPSETAQRRARGLGTFHVLSDEALLDVLPRIAHFSSLLDPECPSLEANPSPGREVPPFSSSSSSSLSSSTSAAHAARAAQCLVLMGKLSRVWSVLSRQPSLWKELFLWAAVRTEGHHTNPQDGPSRALLRAWLGSWRDTYIAQFVLDNRSSDVDRYILRPRWARLAGPLADTAAMTEGGPSEMADVLDGSGNANRNGNRNGNGDGETQDVPATQSPSNWYLYSDQLYQAFNLATLPLRQWFPYIADYHLGGEGPSAPKRKKKTLSKVSQRRLAHTPIPRVTMMRSPSAEQNGHITLAAATPAPAVPSPAPSVPDAPGGSTIPPPHALTAEEFFLQHCLTNQPAIIDASGVRRDPAHPEQGEVGCMSWTLDKLARDFVHDAEGREKLFAAEGFSCTLPVYRDYARSCRAFDDVYRDDAAMETGWADQSPDGDQGQRQHQDQNGDQQRAGEGGDAHGTVPAAWWDPENVADESPIYLFDAAFANDPRAKEGWRVPPYLGSIPAGLHPFTLRPTPPLSSSGPSASASEPESLERRETKADLFRLFGSYRPDYRWIIAGPRRSGSGWHKDPNMTSAWNTILDGSKLWLMLPPDTPPPGVYVTDDEAEVTAPLSIAEWIYGFYDETKRLHGHPRTGGDGKLLEGVCRRGETVYVPSGWWHLVINLEECVALTQNFVSAGPVLASVLDFMKNRWEQVSGFKGCEDHDGDQEQDIQEADAGGGRDAAASHAVSDSAVSGTGELLDGSDDRDVWSAATLFDRFCERLRAFDPDLLERALHDQQVLHATRHKQETASGAVQRHRPTPTPTPTPAPDATKEKPTLLADWASGQELEEMPW